MPFKFVNWFFEQKKQESKLGELAKRCVADDNFPVQSRRFQEVLEYFESNEFKQADMKTLLEAWEVFRKLAKVKVIPINQLRSKYFDPSFR